MLKVLHVGLACILVKINDLVLGMAALINLADKAVRQYGVLVNVGFIIILNIKEQGREALGFTKTLEMVHLLAVKRLVFYIERGIARCYQAIMNTEFEPLAIFKGVVLCIHHGTEQ